jgi:hypothetical protein
MKKSSLLRRALAPALVALLLASGLAAIAWALPEPASAQTSFAKNLACDGRFYPSVKNYLRAGDVMRESAIRSAPDQPMTAGDSKFKTAVAQLMAANKPGLERELTLSAVADVRNLIGQVPAEIRWIDYNLEGGMSPSSEMGDKAAAVKAFAAIVHASGRKVAFGPTRSGWSDIQKQGQLAAVLAVVDSAAIQEQKQTNYTADIKALYTLFRKTNPRVIVRMQLWLGQQTAVEMISGFTASQDYLDQANIGTHGDLAGVLTVLQGLGSRDSIAQVPTDPPTRLPTPDAKFNIYMPQVSRK